MADLPSKTIWEAKQNLAFNEPLDPDDHRYLSTENISLYDYPSFSCFLGTISFELRTNTALYKGFGFA